MISFPPLFPNRSVSVALGMLQPQQQPPEAASSSTQLHNTTPYLASQQSNPPANVPPKVSSELKKMTAFIRQEALEKAREIQLKADEEFAIEKSRLVREETSSIDAEYSKKFKQAGMSQQITRSTVSNKSRIRILSARQELVDGLFDRAKEQVGKEKTDYQAVCKGLVLEGLYRLNEKNVQVRCRKKDVDVVKKAASEASKEYKDNMGKESKVEIDEKNPLPEDSTGGVTISGTQGKIDINNTFEERLKILETEALPQMRLILFGENTNRTFKN